MASLDNILINVEVTSLMKNKDLNKFYGELREAFETCSLPYHNFIVTNNENEVFIEFCLSTDTRIVTNDNGEIEMVISLSKD